VLEAANFSGPRVRRMSGALGLRSEASSRHEKSLAPALTDLGAARAAQLLADLGAAAYRPHVFGAAIEAPQPIALPAGEVERLLGLRIAPERIAAHLTALGCTVVSDEDGTFEVTPPPWRRDLTIPADLVEEVARIEGYDRIAAVVPSVPAHEISSASFDLENGIARVLAGLGYREIVTHSLRAAAGASSVEVRNPLSEEHRFLRDSLAPGLIDYLAEAGMPARVFEIGDVFTRDGERVVEHTTAAFGFSSDRTSEASWRDSSFLRLKGDCEALLHAVTGRRAEIARATQPGFHPGKTATVALDGRTVGTLGCIDPRTARAAGLKQNAYCCLLELGALPSYSTPQYRPPSRFPSTYRDLALVVATSLPARELETAIAETLGSICTGVHVFDEYRGSQVAADRKSLAVRITLQRFDTTITDEEADAAVVHVLEALREKFGATIRT
jgi:phenylalanyl-tRNA synthetase beta chain